ncbi:helix-turn-helix transcriptional regulator [Echinicola sp. CAU 1574]|uniref:Helix-turn-helix transcriptional regulator n=1 Tax=Echinicola arenosa TaxID=2774144 RepID=A0ABR9AQM4_9BACT|nr:helix-turn-helix domain-containing protein [Echinicola arenosa]MBD8490682.1 helix-turn-helix transcriptional regulator [Echinicola arenosa]
MDEEILKKYGDVDTCPVRNILDRFGDKWSTLVLLVLGEKEKLRFNELNKCIQTISQKMLTVTLKKLETDGLVNRTIYPHVPPKVEYELTDLGRSLLPNLQNLVKWANDNIDEIKTNRTKIG